MPLARPVEADRFPRSGFGSAPAILRALVTHRSPWQSAPWSKIGLRIALISRWLCPSSGVSARAPPCSVASALPAAHTRPAPGKDSLDLLGWLPRLNYRRLDAASPRGRQPIPAPAASVIGIRAWAP